MDLDLYKKEQYDRVKKLYNGKKHTGFKNRIVLADWYILQLEENKCRCYYCETSIHDIIHLIKA